MSNSLLGLDVKLASSLYCGGEALEKLDVLESSVELFDLAAESFDDSCGVPARGAGMKE